MPLTIARPSWPMIEKLIRGSKSRLIICSPWISETGVVKLARILSANLELRSIEIWARFVEVLTDSQGIEKLARSLEQRGTAVIVRNSKNLTQRFTMRTTKPPSSGRRTWVPRGSTTDWRS